MAFPFKKKSDKGDDKDAKGKGNPFAKGSKDKGDDGDKKPNPFAKKDDSGDDPAPGDENDGASPIGNAGGSNQPKPKEKSFGSQDKYLKKDKIPEKGKPDTIIINPKTSDLFERLHRILRN